MKTKITSSIGDFSETESGLWQRAIPSTRWLARRVFVVLLSITLLGSSAIPAQLARVKHFEMAVAGHTWDLVSWEANALYDKAIAVMRQPANGLQPADAAEIVQQYMERARRIGEIEGMLARLAVLPAAEGGEYASDSLTAELVLLRESQRTSRMMVEQVIEQQVTTVLAEEEFFGVGFRVWPPVSFTFVEPPKKLVVSRRDRIETIYSQMLEAEIALGEIQAAEQAISQQYNAVGYVTDIGGLGAFPTMVVDRASLRWVLSTVAHEWTHNYLVFHPLGWNYFQSQELTTMNETVAEIVGNEIGDKTLARYYPALAPPPEPLTPPIAPPVAPEPPTFEFQVEMRETRLEVDRLLAAGDVEGAEQYMETRRQFFVENGYPLRVLNQAYFAFHGSYGTSPASTSPIGPKLEALRARMPDIETFLTVTRSFTRVDDLDRALAEWGVP